MNPYKCAILRKRPHKMKTRPAKPGFFMPAIPHEDRCMAAAESDVERRHMQTLSDEELDRIADRAAKKALDKVYQDVGRATLNKLAWLVGAAILGLLIWLGKNGIDLK